MLSNNYTDNCFFTNSLEPLALACGLLTDIQWARVLGSEQLGVQRLSDRWAGLLHRLLPFQIGGMLFSEAEAQDFLHVQGHCLLESHLEEGANSYFGSPGSKH